MCTVGDSPCWNAEASGIDELRQRDECSRFAPPTPLKNATSCGMAVIWSVAGGTEQHHHQTGVMAAIGWCVDHDRRGATAMVMPALIRFRTAVLGPVNLSTPVDEEVKRNDVENLDQGSTGSSGASSLIRAWLARRASWP